MGAQRIKLKNKSKEERAAFYMARPFTYTRRFRVWLWLLSLLGLAKKSVSVEKDRLGRPLVELHGYAYKGSIYLTKQVNWEYPK